MSKRLVGGIILLGCKDKTSSWHLNEFLDGSNAVEFLVVPSRTPTNQSTERKNNTNARMFPVYCSLKSGFKLSPRRQLEIFVPRIHLCT